VTALPDKIMAIHGALETFGVPHAFGGALALAWCTERARGTIDIDLNIFIDASRASEMLNALPSGVAWTAQDRAAIERDGQARLWWDTTPIDLFMNTTEFHAQLANRARYELFAGAQVPFLSCPDLAVFKAFFNRTRDWADLEAMAAAGTLDLDRVLGVLTRYLGPTDERIDRLRRLT
jgi:hypothetical protein